MIEFKDVAFQYEQGSSKGKIENINLTNVTSRGEKRCKKQKEVEWARINSGI